MNQRDRILQHLRAGNALNRLDSWRLLGVIETPARISELRQQGHDIRTRMVSVENRFGETVKVAEWTMAKK